jgi:hypothetical protein
MKMIPALICILVTCHAAIAADETTLAPAQPQNGFFFTYTGYRKSGTKYGTVSSLPLQKNSLTELLEWRNWQTRQT